MGNSQTSEENKPPSPRESRRTPYDDVTTGRVPPMSAKDVRRRGGAGPPFDDAIGLPRATGDSGFGVLDQETPDHDVHGSSDADERSGSWSTSERENRRDYGSRTGAVSDVAGSHDYGSDMDDVTVSGHSLPMTSMKTALGGIPSLPPNSVLVDMEGPSFVSFKTDNEAAVDYSPAETSGSGWDGSDEPDCVDTKTDKEAAVNCSPAETSGSGWDGSDEPDCVDTKTDETSRSGWDGSDEPDCVDTKTDNEAAVNCSPAETPRSGWDGSDEPDCVDTKTDTVNPTGNGSLVPRGSAVKDAIASSEPRAQTTSAAPEKNISTDTVPHGSMSHQRHGGEVWSDASHALQISSHLDNAVATDGCVISEPSFLFPISSDVDSSHENVASMERNMSESHVPDCYRYLDMQMVSRVQTGKAEELASPSTVIDRQKTVGDFVFNPTSEDDSESTETVVDEAVIAPPGAVGPSSSRQLATAAVSVPTVAGKDISTPSTSTNAVPVQTREGISPLPFSMPAVGGPSHLAVPGTRSTGKVSGAGEPHTGKRTRDPASVLNCIPDKNVCRVHPTQRIFIWCATCRVPLCKMCIEPEHALHDLQGFSPLEQDERRKVLAELEEGVGQWVAVHKNEAEDLRVISNAILLEKEAAILAVRAKVEGVMAAVRAAEEQAVADLEGQASSLLQPLAQRRRQMEEWRRHASDVTASSKELLERAEGVQLVSACDVVTRRLEQLTASGSQLASGAKGLTAGGHFKPELDLSRVLDVAKSTPCYVIRRLEGKEFIREVVGKIGKEVRKGKKESAGSQTTDKKAKAGSPRLGAPKEKSKSGTPDASSPDGKRRTETPRASAVKTDVMQPADPTSEDRRLQSKLIWSASLEKLKKDNEECLMRSLCIDARNGHVIIGDLKNKKLMRFGLEGNFINQQWLDGSPCSIALGHSALAVVMDGQFCILPRGFGQIQKKTAIPHVMAANDAPSPTTVAALSDETFIVGNLEENRLVWFNSCGDLVREGSCPVKRPILSIYEDHRKNLLFSSWKESSVVMVSPAGELLKTFKREAVNSVTGKYVWFPNYAIATKDDLVIVADYKPDEIVVFAPDGQILDKMKLPCVKNPRNLAYDAVRDVVVVSNMQGSFACFQLARRKGPGHTAHDPHGAPSISDKAVLGDKVKAASNIPGAVTSVSYTSAQGKPGLSNEGLSSLLWQENISSCGNKNKLPLPEETASQVPRGDFACRPATAEPRSSNLRLEKNLESAQRAGVDAEHKMAASPVHVGHRMIWSKELVRIGSDKKVPVVCGIAFHPTHQRVFVADSANKAVKQFRPNGDFVILSRPKDVTFSSMAFGPEVAATVVAGKLWLLDSTKLFAAKKKNIYIPGALAESNQSAPVVACLMESLFVIGNLKPNLLVYYDFDGQLAKTTLCPVKTPITFLCEDHEGHLLICSGGERAVIQVASGGQRLHAFQGLLPGAAVRDKRGRVIATDTESGRLVIFSPDGTMLCRYSLLKMSSPRHLTYDFQQDCLFVCSEDGMLACLSHLDTSTTSSAAGSPEAETVGEKHTLNEPQRPTVTAASTGTDPSEEQASMHWGHGNLSHVGAASESREATPLEGKVIQVPQLRNTGTPSSAEDSTWCGSRTEKCLDLILIWTIKVTKIGADKDDFRFGALAFSSEFRQLIVGDSANGSIKCFKMDGSFMTTRRYGKGCISSFSYRPTVSAAVMEGFLVLLKSSSQFQPLRSAAIPNIKGTSGDDAPVVIALEGKAVLVANLKDDVMLEYSFEGEIIKSTSCPVKGPVSCLSEDHEGHLLFSSLGERAVVLVSGSGERLLEFRGLLPGSAVRDTLGHVIATDVAKGHLVVFSPEGEVLCRQSVDGMANPRHLTYDPQLDHLCVGSPEGDLACLKFHRNRASSAAVCSSELEPDDKSGNSPGSSSDESMAVLGGIANDVVSPVERLGKPGQEKTAEAAAAKEVEEDDDVDDDDDVGYYYDDDYYYNDEDDDEDDDEEPDASLLAASKEVMEEKTVAIAEGKKEGKDKEGEEVPVPPAVRQEEEVEVKGEVEEEEKEAAVAPAAQDKQKEEETEEEKEEKEVEASTAAQAEEEEEEPDASLLAASKEVMEEKTVAIAEGKKEDKEGEGKEREAVPAPPAVQEEEEGEVKEEVEEEAEEAAAAAARDKQKEEETEEDQEEKVEASAAAQAEEEEVEEEEGEEKEGAASLPAEAEKEETDPVSPHPDVGLEINDACASLPHEETVISGTESMYPSTLSNSNTGAGQSTAGNSISVIKHWTKSVTRVKSDKHVPTISALAFSSQFKQILVGDGLNENIRRFKADGSFMTIRKFGMGFISSLSYSTTMSVAVMGETLVLLKPSSQFQLATLLPKVEAAPGDDAPVAAIIQDKTVLVANLQDDVMLEFNFEGEIIKSTPCPVKGPVSCLSEDHEGHLLFSSLGERAVVLVSGSGKRLREFRGLLPGSAVRDTLGHVIATDVAKGHLVVFSPEGEVLCRQSVDGVANPRHLAYDPHLNCFYISSQDGTLVSLSLLGSSETHLLPQEENVPSRMETDVSPGVNQHFQHLQDDVGRELPYRGYYNMWLGQASKVDSFHGNLGEMTRSSGVAVAGPLTPRDLRVESKDKPATPLNQSNQTFQQSTSGERNKLKVTSSYKANYTIQWVETLQKMKSDSQEPLIGAMAFNASNKRILIVDRANSAIKQFKETGEFILLRRLDVESPTCLCSADSNLDVAVVSGKLCFLETATYTQKTSGKIKGILGSSVDTAPLVAAVGPDAFAVCRLQNNVVSIYNTSGKKVQSVQCTARTPITSATSGGLGRLLLCSPGSQAVVLAALEGQGLRSLREIPFASPLSAVINKDGFVFAIDGEDDALVVFDPDDRLVLRSKIKKVEKMAFLAYNKASDVILVANESGVFASLKFKFQKKDDAKKVKAAEKVKTAPAAVNLQDHISNTAPQISQFPTIHSNPDSRCDGPSRPFAFGLQSSVNHPLTFPITESATSTNPGKNICSEFVPSKVEIVVHLLKKITSVGSEKKQPVIRYMTFNCRSRHIIASDAANLSLKRYNDQGKFLVLRRFEAEVPVSIACASNRAVAIHSGKVVLLETGTYTMTATAKIEGSMKFDTSSAPLITVFSDDSFALCRLALNNMAILDPEGRLTKTLKCPVRGPLTSLTTDPEDNMVVSSHGSGSVVVIPRCGGRVLRTVAMAQPKAAVVDKYGFLFVIDGADGSLVVFCPKDRLILRHRVPGVMDLTFLAYSREMDELYIASETGSLAFLSLTYASAVNEQACTEAGVEVRSPAPPPIVTQPPDLDPCPTSALTFASIVARKRSESPSIPLASIPNGESTVAVTLSWKVKLKKHTTDTKDPTIETLAFNPASQRLIVGDGVNEKIRLYNTDGAFLQTIKLVLGLPSSIACNGAVMAAVAAEHLCLLEAHKLTLKSRMPIPGCKSVLWPTAPNVAALRDGSFVMVNADGNKLLFFSEDEQLAGKFQSSAKGPLASVSECPDGNLLVSSGGSSSVVVLSRMGSKLMEYNCQFPSSSVQTKQGLIVVACGEEALLIFTQDGQAFHLRSLKENPRHLVYDAERDRVYASTVDGVLLCLEFQDAMSEDEKVIVSSSASLKSTTQLEKPVQISTETIPHSGEDLVLYTRTRKPRPLPSKTGEQLTAKISWSGSAKLQSDTEVPGISTLAFGEHPARLVLCDIFNKQFKQFGTSGFFQTFHTADATPTSLVIRGSTAVAIVDGKLLFLDAASLKVTSQAEIPGAMATSGCTSPVVSAFSDGIFVVGNVAEDRLLLYGGSGRHLGTLSSPVPGPLVSLASTYEDSLLVCSWGASCVVEVSLNGKRVATYPAPDWGGTLWLPTAAVKVGREAVVVAAKDCPHLAVYPGSQVPPSPLTVEGVTSPLHLAFDPSTKWLYVSSWNGEMACLSVSVH